MLLMIHNLPINIKYDDLKLLISSKCGISDVVLDNLISEGLTKRVTVGLADDGDAAIMVRKINGLYLGGQQLYVEHVRQKAESEQLYKPKQQFQPQNFEGFSSGTYQQNPPRNVGFQETKQSALDFNQDWTQKMVSKRNMQEMSMNQDQMAVMNYNMQMAGMCYMPTITPMQPTMTNFMGFNDTSQQVSMVPPPLVAPSNENMGFGFGGQRQGEGNVRGWEDTVRGRRSPSPPVPHWELRQSESRTSTAAFAKFYDEPAPRTEPQPYDRSRSFNKPEPFRPDRPSRPRLDEPLSTPYGSHVSARAGFEGKPERVSRFEPERFRARDRAEQSKPRGPDFGLPRDAPQPFERRDRGPVHDRAPPQNWRNVPGGPPKRISRWQDEGPPAKRTLPPRNTGDDKNWKEPKFEPQKPKFEAPRNDKVLTQEESLRKALNKDETWRGQATSLIAKEIVNFQQKNRGKVVDAETFTRLKRSIRSRVNLLLGTTISNSVQDVVDRYRKRFPKGGDSKLLEAVIEEKALSDAAKLETDDIAPNNEKAPAAPKAKKPTPFQPAMQKKNSTLPTAQPDLQEFDMHIERLPQYPNADKKSVHNMKLFERKNQGEIIKDLPVEIQKAIEEEIDVLSDLFMTECMNPEDDQEKVVCEEIADVVSDEFRKVVRQHLAKRLLNLNLNLTVRALAQGRIPPRDVLETFVRDYGAIALKKSDKGGNMYIVYVDSYENYDLLCSLKEVSVSGILIHFKPLHILGPPPSAKDIRDESMARNKRFRKNFIDKTNENILVPGYTLTFPELATLKKKKIKNDKTQNSEDKNQNANKQNESSNGQNKECVDLTEESKGQNCKIVDQKQEDDEQIQDCDDQNNADDDQSNADDDQNNADDDEDDDVQFVPAEYDEVATVDDDDVNDEDVDDEDVDDEDLEDY